jgi:hypothetical protein
MPTASAIEAIEAPRYPLPANASSAVSRICSRRVRPFSVVEPLCGPAIRGSLGNP